MRKPDFVVGSAEDPYLYRWWVIPRNKYLNIYLHKFLRSDDDRALHDHPWPSLGVILWGRYREHMPKDRYNWIKHGNRDQIVKTRYPLQPVYRNANHIHRIELMQGKPVWTLFLTGSWTRDWGFWCDFGFRGYKEFVSNTEAGNDVGLGCD